MNEERVKILNMVQEGKLTVDEATKLISSIETSQEKEEEGKKAKWLKINITENGEQKVAINLPISLAKMAMKFIPDNSLQSLSEKNINIDEIFSMITTEKAGKIVEVTDGGNNVEISID